ncbi:helix-turn-helix domain-containing protein [Brevibacillus laterosporus]|uniref:helix-turn-helix domain-containing protein n=1 Tax=Brevibacillus laterosporus TaxID=1465 RepID=UPI000CE4280F|nr:helix-turn-helix transcriptional regulator [Brevibacillus laterosporus]AYB39710.1 XRE family transcriptional regulator [Brevibacillus laterosporus]MBM7109138.1 hypothetical protein [Brevibacillus laterosporus]PPA82498.1 hypothetical protein C4A75_18435 [Brevibacillus laterosporus]
MERDVNSYGFQLGNSLMELDMTQQKFAEEANVSRETVSAYKNERANAPSDIKAKSVHITDNPFLAIAAAHESSGGTSAPILNGNNVEMNRHTCLIKTVEELEELLVAIKAVKPILIKPPNQYTAEERMQIEAMLQETLDVNTSCTNMTAIICKETKISWIGQWTKHTTKLVARGFLKIVKG